MFEQAFVGTKKYYGVLAGLGFLIALGALGYYQQLTTGLGITGMGRDVSWGFYIAQFTYLVGVAASGVMVVLPYYLHDYKAFGRITILGEFLAVAAVTMCLLFIVADLGRPDRLFNIIKYPTSQFRALLGYGGAQRLSALEHRHRLECPGSGAQRHQI